MRQDIRVLDRVRGAYASLRPSEQRVADYVLKDPETCTRCTHFGAGRPGAGEPAHSDPFRAGPWI